MVLLLSRKGADLRVGPPVERTGAHTGAPLPTIIQRCENAGLADDSGQLWQRSYYDHIIRDADSLHRIRQYIVDNPAR